MRGDGIMILTNEYTPLSEAAVRSAGDTIRIRIISPGWGSSGYYSPSVLEKAAPLYKSGTKMFLNHPTRSEAKERPERDLNQLAGYLSTDAKYERNGAYGPGLYADAKLMPGQVDFIKSAAPVIGISHYCEGKTTHGTAEGRSGPIVEAIMAVHSVDIVTTPGRGGAIIQESGRGPAGSISSLEESSRGFYESYIRSGMSESAAKSAVQSITGVNIRPNGSLPEPGSLEEAQRNLIESYVRSGMREDTARKTVLGL